MNMTKFDNSPRQNAPADTLERMRTDWDRRARENARHYIATGHHDWTDEEFFQSGRLCIENQVLSDMGNIVRGGADANPRQMRVLEIGCGAARLTQALANVFGEVHGVDVSGEMVAQARENLRKLGISNAFVYENNGQDLTVVPNLPFHFAFSWIVFQHIPSKAVIESYIREVHRLLVPGGLFKFQAQGYPLAQAEHDTWLGVSFTEEEMVEMADRCGFERRYQYGAGSQEYVNWFFRR